MFKNKKFVGLFVVLGLLLAMAATKNIFEKQKAVVQDMTKEKETTAVLVKNLPPETVTQIILFKGAEPDKKIELKRENGNAWILTSRYGIRAREGAVGSFLNELLDLRGTVRASSKNVFSDFKIADNDGFHIVLKNIAGKDIVHLIIGGVIPQWGVQFVRLSGDDKIVKVEGKNIIGSIGLFTPDDILSDRSLGEYRIVSTDVLKAERIEMTLPKKESYVLAKTDTWAFEPPDSRSAIEPSKVDGFLRILSEAMAHEAVDPKGADYGFEQPLADMKFSFKEGAESKISEVQLGAAVASENMYYMRVLPEGFVYKVPENTALNFKQSKSYFLKQSPKKK